MFRGVLIFLLLKIFLGSLAVADKNREKITLDLIKALEIRQCIRIVKENFNLENINIFKKFSKINIELLFLTKEALTEFIAGNVVVYWSTAIIIETDSLNMIRDLFELLKKAKKEHDVSKFKWLVFLNKAGEFEIESSKLEVPYDCEFVVIRRIGSNLYDLKEIYNIKEIKISHDFGLWDEKLGLSVTKVPFYVRRLNLHNVTMVYAADVQKRNYCPPGGYLGCAKREVFYDMEKMLNFNIHFVKYERGRRDEYADVYDSRSSFHSYFFNYDTIAPMFKAYLNWYIREPEVEPRQDFYVQPFEVDLWYSVFFTIFISSVVISISGFINKLLRREPPLPQLIDNVFTTFELFCSQDGGEHRDYASFRVALITILLTTLFILPSYSAVITSFLAVRVPKIPFRTLDEFVENGKYILIRKEGALFPELYFKENENPLIQLVRDRFVKAYSEEEGLRKTCKGLYSMTAPNIYLKDDNAGCSFYQIPKAITFYFLQLTLRKNSVFRDAFMHVLPPFYSSGIISHLQEDLDEVPIKNIDENQFFPVRIHQMVHIFLMVVVGCAFAIIILFLEIIFKYGGRCRSLVLLRKNMKVSVRKDIAEKFSKRRCESDYEFRMKRQILW